MFEPVQVADDLEVLYAGRARWSARTGRFTYDFPLPQRWKSGNPDAVHILIQEIGHCRYVSKSTGRHSLLNEGQLVVVSNRNLDYRMECSEEYGLLGVTLTGAGAKSFENGSDSSGCPNIAVHNCNSRIKSYLEEIRWECRQRDLSFASALRGQLDLLNVNLQRQSREKSAAEAEAATPSVVSKARQYLNDHLASDLSLKDVSRAVGLSPNRLLAVFGESMQNSPMAYLRELRLAKAHELLQSGEFRVKEISAAVGYTSIEVFSHAYRRQYNCSPMETARRAQQDAIKRT